MLSAQEMGRGNTAPRQPGANPGIRHALPVPEPVTVSGSLIVANGFPAVKSGDVTYLVGGVNRLTGFIDGFKAGAQVTIEGKAFTSPKDSNLKFLRPSSLTLNGNTYDLSPPQFLRAPADPSNPGKALSPNAPRRQNFQPQRPRGPRFQGPGRQHERFL